MLLTAFQIFCVVLIISVILLIVADIDLHAAKESQKAERMFKYLGYAQVTIQEKIREDGVGYQMNKGLLPPVTLSEDYVALRGQHGYYEDEGRYLMLDLFHPNGIFKGPLNYWENDQVWFLISRGPNQELDITTDTLNLLEISSKAMIDQNQLLMDFTYDPSNGALSVGDLFVYGNMKLME